MKAKDAVEILVQASKQARMTFEDHALCAKAAMVLSEALKEAEDQKAEKAAVPADF